MKVGRIFSLFIPILIGVAFLVMGYLAPIDALTSDGYQLNNFFYFMGACFIIPIFAIQIFALFAGSKQKRLLANGIQGTAIITSLEDTGMLINHNPRVIIGLKIQIPGHTPYQISKTVTVPLINLPQVQPGQQIAVLVDSSDPQKPANVGLVLK